MRSPANARFQFGLRAAHAQITHRLVARPNSPKWKPALKACSDRGRKRRYNSKDTHTVNELQVKQVVHTKKVRVCDCVCLWLASALVSPQFTLGHL